MINPRTEEENHKAAEALEVAFTRLDPSIKACRDELDPIGTAHACLLSALLIARSLGITNEEFLECTSDIVDTVDSAVNRHLRRNFL